MGCRMEVSEWAARCPHCGRALDNAEEIALSAEARPATPAVRVEAGEVTTSKTSSEAVASIRSTLRPTKFRFPSFRRRLIAAVAVFVVVVVAVAVGSESGRSGRGQRSKPSRAASGAPHLPAGLANENLFIANGGSEGIFRADGGTVTSYRAPNAVGSALATADGLAVFVHGHEAYRAATSDRIPHLIGPGTSVFPANAGAVGIESARDGRRSYVYYVAADGVLPYLTGLPAPIPPGVSVVAQLSHGLLVRPKAAGSQGIRLRVIEGRKPVALPAVTAVIGADRTTVAALICRGPDREVLGCPLYLLGTATHTDRSVPIPVGMNGYVQGGGFSPDGALLAAFVLEPQSGTVQLAIVDTVTLTVSVIAPPLSLGAQVGSVTWSQDGRWVFWHGPNTRLYAQQIPVRGPVGRPWPLSVPRSAAVTGL